MAPRVSYSPTTFRSAIRDRVIPPVGDTPTRLRKRRDRMCGDRSFRLRWQELDQLSLPWPSLGLAGPDLLGFRSRRGHSECREIGLFFFDRLELHHLQAKRGELALEKLGQRSM